MMPLPMHPPRVRRLAQALAWLGAAALGPVAAQTATAVVEPPKSDSLTYALGGALVSGPTYAGSGGQELKARPLWALRYGRFRVSGSRASGLLAAPNDGGSGASADLVETAHWRLGAALRVDNGRASSDDPALAGLPDVKRTLRGRVYGGVTLGGRWSGQLGYAHDLLGRGGGATANLGLGYGWTPWPGLEASVGAGLTLADRQYMSTYYGISPTVAAATGRPAFSPKAGLLDINGGIGLRAPLAGRWVIFGGVGMSQLQGDAATSPVTGRRSGVTASVALAWRSQ